ncbi:MAG: hypothetical protein ABI323_05955 [Solirubrobacteraceae bacterium]
MTSGSSADVRDRGRSAALPGGRSRRPTPWRAGCPAAGAAPGPRRCLVGGGHGGRNPESVRRPCKPSTLRGYEQALRKYVYPALGEAKLQDVRAGDVQRLVDDLVGRGLNPSTVRNSLLPLRAICRRALRQGDVNANPTAGVEIPAVRGRRTRIVTPAEALALIQTAPADDQALWAAAFYAGLRRGELQALAWTDIDLATA